MSDKLVKVDGLGVVKFPDEMPDEHIAAAIAKHKGQIHWKSPTPTGITTEESEHQRQMKLRGAPAPDVKTIENATFPAMSEPLLPKLVKGLEKYAGPELTPEENKKYLISKGVPEAEAEKYKAMTSSPLRDLINVYNANDQKKIDEIKDRGWSVVNMVRGVEAGGRQVADGLSNPENLALIGLMTVMAPFRLVRMMVDLGFTYSMAKSAAEGFQKAVKAAKKGDAISFSEEVTTSSVDALFAFLSGSHLKKDMSPAKASTEATEVKSEAPVAPIEGKVDTKMAPQPQFSPEDVSVANKTSRSSGAVGKNAVVPRHVASIARPGESILDFGAGVDAGHARDLRGRGLNVTAHDFGSNARPGFHDFDALSRKYDHVYASNVLNVQSSPEMLGKTLDQIRDAVKPGGDAFVNLPKTPRKFAGLNGSLLKSELEKRFGRVDKIGGTADAPMFKVSDPQDGSGVQEARSSEGKLKLGADPAALGKLLGSSLYGSNSSMVITKELVQNAMDAVRGESGDKNVTVSVDDYEHTIQVKDTGKGMTKNELETVFTDLGSSGKRDDVTASGGFGLAKAAPLMMSKSIKVTTVVNEGGSLYRHTFEATPEDLLGGGVDIHTEKLSTPEPTGTSVLCKLPDNAYMYGAYEYLGSSRLSLRPPATIKVISNGHEVGPEEAKQLPSAPDSTEHYQGADMDLYISKVKGDKAFDRWNKLNVEVHNNGIYQFMMYMDVPEGVRGLPSRVAIDVHATVPEGNPDYPFLLNRESLRDEASSDIKKLIQERVIDPVVQGHRNTVAGIYNSLPTFKGRKDIPLFDSGQRFTLEEMKEISANAQVIKIASKIQSLARGAIDMLKGSEIHGTGSGIDRIGIVFSDKVHGVYIPNPADTSKATIFIDPFNQIGENPYQAASSVWHTIKHEILHDTYKGHNQSFTTGEVRIARSLGEMEVKALNELRKIYADPNDSTRIREDLSGPLQIYRESRGRSESSPDIFGGEELRSEMAHARGQQGGDGGVHPGGEVPVPGFHQNLIYRSADLDQPFFNKIYVDPNTAGPKEVAAAKKELEEISEQLKKMAPPETPDAQFGTDKWLKRHQDWMRANLPLVLKRDMAVKKYLDLDGRGLGEVRKSSDGTKIVFLSRKGLRALNTTFDGKENLDYESRGCSISPDAYKHYFNQAKIMNPPEELNKLLRIGQNYDGGAIVSFLPRGEKIHSVLAVLREELNHKWQESLVKIRMNLGLLSVYGMKEMDKSIPKPLELYLETNGYPDKSDMSENGVEQRVFEATAKLMSDKPSEFGLTVDEATAYLLKFFQQVYREYGVQGFQKLTHTTNAVRRLKEGFIDEARKPKPDWASLRKTDPGVVGRVRSAGAQWNKKGSSGPGDGTAALKVGGSVKGFVNSNESFELLDSTLLTDADKAKLDELREKLRSFQ